MKKLVYFLLFVFGLALFNSCTEQSLDDSEVLEDAHPQTSSSRPLTGFYD
mgnify:CR=1 FL=1